MPYWFNAEHQTRHSYAEGTNYAADAVLPGLGPCAGGHPQAGIWVLGLHKKYCSIDRSGTAHFMKLSEKLYSSFKQKNRPSIERSAGRFRVKYS
jgi:hypothetical protein